MCLRFAMDVDERILLTQAAMYKGVDFGLLSISHATYNLRFVYMMAQLSLLHDHV